MTAFVILMACVACIGVQMVCLWKLKDQLRDCQKDKAVLEDILEEVI